MSAADRMQVVLLGTGTPNAETDRWGAATCVVAGGAAHVVDAGAGVVRRAAAARERHDLDALAPVRLERCYLTHLHSDHTVGLPDLMLSPWTLGRAAPLAVTGPPGTRALVEGLQSAYAEDVRIRRAGEEPCNHTGWLTEAVETAGGAVAGAPGVAVEAFPVRHGSCPHALGYRFESAGRVVVVSGDTAPSDELARRARGADVLVHEVYSAARLATRPPEWQRYHRAFHTSTVEVARLASAAGVRLLVLTHLLLWGATPGDLLAEVRAAGYEGDLACGADLDRLEVS